MADDRDRFGEKLRQKERAEEDRYFAEQDKAKLEKLKTENAPKPTLGLCPRCGEPLVERDHLGVKIDECDPCGGLWFDRGEFETLAEREDEHWPTSWLRKLLGGAD